MSDWKVIEQDGTTYIEWAAYLESQRRALKAEAETEQQVKARQLKYAGDPRHWALADEHFMPGGSHYTTP